MFAIGLMMVLAGIGMAVGAVLGPEEARIGLGAGAVGVGGSGALMAYLDWPARKKAPAEGMVTADAFLIDAQLTGVEATGFRMVEMTLDVRPKGGVPFEVRRKFVARSGRYEPGQKFRVAYDPAQPEKLELI